MPAVHRDSSPESSDMENVQLSKLVGPPLDVPIPRALDMFRVSLEKYYDKLAVASMYQPADYLSPIFENGPQRPDDGNTGDYLRWSYGQVRHAGELLAASLASRGVREGMTVAVLMHGGIDFYLLFYACLVLRCRFSPMNYNSITNATEIQSMLKTVDAKAIVTMNADEMNRVVTNVPELASEDFLKLAIEKPKADQQVNGHSESFEYIEDLIAGALPIENAESILERFESLLPDPSDDVLIIFTR